MIGLIGGLGVGASILYYEQLASRFVALSRPMPLVMVHADMATVVGHVSNGRVVELASYFAGLIKLLADAGATFALIPAVTPHLCYSELAPRSPLPLVSIAEPALAAIRARGIRRVALFGTRFTVEQDMFGLLGSDVEIVKPSAEQIEAVHATYYKIAVDGRTSPGHYELLTEVAQSLKERVDAIVLAGTELALVFDESNTPFPAVDCARLHIDAIVRRMSHGHQ